MGVQDSLFASLWQRCIKESGITMDKTEEAWSFEDHKAWFVNYTNAFIAAMPDDAGPLHLKVEHTWHVLANACAIVEAEGLAGLGSDAEDIRRATMLAALYHDVGRFPQYRDWRTFADALSVNHAVLSAQTLVREGVLKREKACVRRLVLGAVVLHNRYAVPENISEQTHLVTHIVRDADKLDIVRIMAPQLSYASLTQVRKQAAEGGHNVVTMHVQDEPALWSEAIMEDAMAGRVAKYTDMRYVNDFRLVLGTWIKELCFEASRKHLAESGLMEEIFAGLPACPAMDTVTARLLSPIKPYLRQKNA